jgi:hypothetical protein
MVLPLRVVVVPQRHLSVSNLWNGYWSFWTEAPMTTTDIRLTNSRAASLTLFLEPWAEEIILNVGDSILVKQDAVDDGRIELDVVDEGYVLHGNMYAKLRIYRGDEMIWESYEAPAA